MTGHAKPFPALAKKGGQGSIRFGGKVAKILRSRPALVIKEKEAGTFC